MKFIITSILFFAIISFGGCTKNSAEENHQEKTKPEQSNIVKVSNTSIKEIGLVTETVTLKSFNGIMNIPATVIANQDNEAQVGSLVQGRVNKVLVKVGDNVKAGQTLMYVEGLEIGEIKANFLSAKAELDFHKADYERQKTLIEQKVGSQKLLLESKAEYEKALAEFNAEDKKIHSIGLSDEDILNGKANDHTSGTLPVKAPISGLIIERNVVIGQQIEASTNAFRIINTSSVWVDGQIYEKDINRIKENSNVQFTLSTNKNEKFSGKIIYVGQIIDEKSRTITVRAEFNNPNKKLKPQMFGEMLIPSSENSKAVLIPNEAVIKIDNKDFVFVQKDEDKFEKRVVVLGSTQDDLVEVKDGLKENESIVIKGSFYLKSELLKDELGDDD
ncbi:MAG TPA: efflux RND transporter periplasmic adaptor subunit [Ignavibacteriaceae bacterium]|nr:efflux RND transporter periplasmic adaptor subunit [Ignavibacteriaceae bacterium]